MTRAALLPSSGNPYVLGLWLNSFKRVWSSEIDKLYFTIPVPIETNVKTYVIKMLQDAGAIYEPCTHSNQHGSGIELLLSKSKEENILLIEEDCFVLQQGQINKHFDMLKTCDVVASPRGHYTDGIEQAALGKFGERESCFWPNFFFSNRAVLENTSKDFCGTMWHKGDKIESLGLVCTKDECTDTFGRASLEIRSKGHRIQLVPQYHLNHKDLENFEHKIEIFSNGFPPYVHFGSLAGGTATLIDEKGLVLMYRDSPHKGSMDEIDRQDDFEWMRRTTMWKLCRDHFPIKDEDKCYFNAEYDKALGNIFSAKSNKFKPELQAKFKNLYEQLFAPILD